MCERKGRSESETDHKKACIKCGCTVCADYLTEFYSVVEKNTEQTTLADCK